MLLIAHRGNIYGKNEQYENNPNYIEESIKAGFDAELDVWVKHNEIYLGHDGPQFKIKKNFLVKHKHNLWCHAKNYDALMFLLQNNLHCFFHDRDDYTLTSRKFIWATSGKLVSNIFPTIVVMPELTTDFIIPKNIFGVCSDNLVYPKNKTLDVFT